MKKFSRLAVAALWPLALCACQTLADVDLSDSGIKARVESQLQAERGLDISHIDLDVHNRIITVSGLVHSWNEKMTVERIVRRTPGVEQAVVNIVIQE
jgi:osmotically-inducible protein OsmY